ncbi:MAG: thiolase domain-containing protein [Pseudomonadota bacterium]
MRGVSIIGIGSTQFGVLEGKSLKEIGTIACDAAIRDAGIDKSDIEAFFLGNMVSGILQNHETIAPLIGNSVGLRKDIAQTKVEGACCSGGIAIRLAYLLIASGVYDIVLAGGVERMSNAPRDLTTGALASAMDQETEGKAGLTFPGFFALIARRHMYEFGTKLEHLSLVSVKSRKNGVVNPRARFREAVTLETAMNSRTITDPLRLFDCCPIGDGSAAAVLCAAELAKKFASKPIVDIIGSAQTTGSSTAYEEKSLTTMTATVLAGKQAFDMAKIKPSDVSLVELHDCFTIAEIVDSEDLGFFEKGKGGFAVEEGLTQVDGKLPINPSGGLLAKGHPVGATGLGQVYEVVKQLRGEHENQVKGAAIGLTHNLGATGQVCTVHILRRR